MRYNGELIAKIQMFSKDEINRRLLNRVEGSDIAKVFRLRDDIKELLEYISFDQDYPSWFISSLDTIEEMFLDIFQKIPSNHDTSSFSILLNNIYRKLFYNNRPEDRNEYFYPLPFLLNFVKTQSLLQNQKTLQSLIDDYNSVILNGKTNYEAVLSNSQTEFTLLKKNVEDSLALVNKEAAKLGVKRYAEIFDHQAIEHSLIFRTKNEKDQDGNKIQPVWGIGKAQRWLGLAIALIIAIPFFYGYIETKFAIKATDTFTPEVLVHIVSRLILLSLVIFIISFAFKQYRVNMHLYTLNKHRANTLKSFEYLTRAPDKLEPQSYNAILMEVAKSIYESGQTGYIAASDTNSDIPSIIDMSKVITQPKS